MWQPLAFWLRCPGAGASTRVRIKTRRPGPGSQAKQACKDANKLSGKGMPKNLQISVSRLIRCFGSPVSSHLSIAPIFNGGPVQPPTSHPVVWWIAPERLKFKSGWKNTRVISNGTRCCPTFAWNLFSSFLEGKFIDQVAAHRWMVVKCEMVRMYWGYVLACWLCFPLPLVTPALSTMYFQSCQNLGFAYILFVYPPLILAPFIRMDQPLQQTWWRVGWGSCSCATSSLKHL